MTKGPLPQKYQCMADLWNEYLKLIPKDSPMVQFRETKRAFYMGALSCFELVISRFDEGVEATEANLSFMDSLHAELAQFAKLMTAGAD